MKIWNFTKGLKFILVIHSVIKSINIQSKIITT